MKQLIFLLLFPVMGFGATIDSLPYKELQKHYQVGFAIQPVINLSVIGISNWHRDRTKPPLNSFKYAEEKALKYSVGLGVSALGIIAYKLGDYYKDKDGRDISNPKFDWDAVFAHFSSAVLSTLIQWTIDILTYDLSRERKRFKKYAKTGRW